MCDKCKHQHMMSLHAQEFSNQIIQISNQCDMYVNYSPIIVVKFYNWVKCMLHSTSFPI